MIGKLLLQDALWVWALLTVCLLGGLVLNEARPQPLPLAYSPPAARLNSTVGRLAAEDGTPLTRKGDVDLAQMRKISAGHTALILDARPEIFYRIGHIPAALSLPRDDFEHRYPLIEPVLRAHRGQTIIVYCSGRNCDDSQLVGDALAHLGYADVRLFRGGWSDWEEGGLPEEKE